MKTYSCLLIASLIFISACEKNESIDSLDSSSKLLVAIKKNGKFITEFKYDDLNRLIQLNNYHSDTISYSEIYQYDSDNKLIKRTFVGFIETYEYFNNEKLKTTTNYYNATDKEWKIEYQYDEDKISKGITYFNGSESGYIEYKYDSNGNTIERTEYTNWSKQKDIIGAQYKLTYDNKINPIKNLSVYPVDIVQYNNPTYFYHYMAIMSMYPPEYYSTYDYDTTGLPIKEYRIPTREYRDSQTFDYEYTYKKKTNER